MYGTNGQRPWFYGRFFSSVTATDCAVGLVDEKSKERET